MNMISSSQYDMSKDEQLLFTLRSLFEKYGYTQYRMNKFEEYDLYAENKDFLLSDSVITFTDTNGKLMALKPDVTLSIVRNCRFDPEWKLRKVYYHENVYRISGKNRAYSEIMQTGLECIGPIDEYCVSEVLMLAAASLKCISPEAVLDLSHMGILSYYIDKLNLSSDANRRIMKFIGEKNRHELEALCLQNNVSQDVLQNVLTLASLSGTPAHVLSELKKIQCPVAFIQELDSLQKALAAYGLSDMLRINFSVVNDMSYYNGLLFKGYVKGIPDGVLSGGRYDSLMSKMGRKTGAIGFAVYPDLLERLWMETPEYDVDTVLLYDQYADPIRLTEVIRELTVNNEKVLAVRTLPDDLKYKKCLTFSGDEVIDNGRNA